MSSLSLFGLVFFMLVMIGAFAVRSAAGFGAVLIAMPMLAFVLPVSTAVSVTTALTAITSVHQLSRDWRRVAEGRTSPFGGESGKVRNRRVSPVGPRPREGPLTEPTAGAQPWPRERVLMPRSRPR